MSLVGLGLIYEIKVEEKNGVNHCEIDMTLTSPGCPVAPEIMAAVHRAAMTVKGVGMVHINLVWSPPWDAKVHADADTKFEMGIYD
jgi:metal-sulfur cluster biosynthetic enzyme